jgi:uncharacterized protein (DUF433 family)
MPENAVGDYEKAHAMVVSDPEIMGGMPVVRGTRIPVLLIAEMRRQGASIDEILAGTQALPAKWSYWPRSTRKLIHRAIPSVRLSCPKVPA